MPIYKKYIFELFLSEASHVRASLASSGDFRSIIFISFADASDADDDRFDEEVRLSGARHDTIDADAALFKPVSFAFYSPKPEPHSHCREGKVLIDQRQEVIRNLYVKFQMM